MSAKVDRFDHWVIIFSQVNGPELLGPYSEEQLVTRLKELYGQLVQVFPFQGTPLQISTGPFRFLLLSDGRTIPLFNLPEPKDVDPYGHLYDPESAPMTKRDDADWSDENLDDS